MRKLLPFLVLPLLIGCDLATPTDSNLLPPSDSTQTSTGVRWHRWSMCVDGEAYDNGCTSCGVPVWRWTAFFKPTKTDTIKVRNDSGRICSAPIALPDSIRMEFEDVVRNGPMQGAWLQDSTGTKYPIEIGDVFRLRHDSLVALEANR